ncbi:type II secretion system protein [Vibrio parahaemolyticus]|uniref:type II secretion system protein n=1 Tax=Vibrio parahaemolyticus TaxID=670 RepID=UPI00111F30A4|nr:prepilin-type N-terminal cleavage/methylation domain-containing protein [Vibrio parahaemolyticus]EHE7897496.1 type II secretion system protein [Vibrio parahaemolyticus]EHR5465705.1 type II secretion system protein [Vibrio parahaemolyticus]EJE4227496.1 type II secretion system protein [Vibrio parahaemolyticus]EKI0737283.1 type II secretion system protein [Vibrio parahaemolyticus]MBE4142426.1 type II secretion system protein [Vibrio parahaemolyticus]
MKRQGGFTLIELVVVIVILGILAVTAAPRFLNLQDDARKASLQGLKGAIDGAAGITYGKAAVEGVEGLEKGNAKAIVEGIALAYGYPTEAGLDVAVTGLADDWKEFSLTNASTAFTFSGRDTTGWKLDLDALTDTSKTSGCYVAYIEATDKTAATAAKTVIADDKC